MAEPVVSGDLMGTKKVIALTVVATIAFEVVVAMFNTDARVFALETMKVLLPFLASLFK